MSARPTIEVGNLFSENPENEIVSMASRHLNVLHQNNFNTWTVERIFDAEGMVGSAWGARIGDYYSSIPGNEIFLIYEGVLDTSFGTVFHHDGTTWQDLIVYSEEVGMDSVAGEFDSDHAGSEFIVTTEMGPTYQIVEGVEPPPEWPKTKVWDNFDHAGWVCKLGDVDADHLGNEIIYGSRYSNSIMLSWPNGSGEHDFQIIFTGENTTGPGNIWDLSIGNVIRGNGIQEIVGVDNSGRVYLVWQQNHAWVGQVIWENPLGPVFSVAVADFTPSLPGDEILVGDEAGRLVLLTLSPSIIFKDGFESGDLSAWQLSQ